MTIDFGQVAYDAYCDTRNWKSFNGDPLPQWPDVKPDIQAGWRQAAVAVLNAHASPPPQECGPACGCHASEPPAA